MSLDEVQRAASVIGIGASAGGVEALTRLVRHLPSDIPAAILVVLHVPSSGRSALPSILDRAGPLPSMAATDGAPLRHGVVVVAPNNRHLIVEDGTVRLVTGPRENGHRPAVDPLLSSIAAYGSNAIGVIVSGTRDDGTQGMLAIKAAGGTTLVQDPEEALFDGMIRSALQYVEIDAVLGIPQLADRLGSLARSLATAKEDSAMNQSLERGSDPADDRSATRYTCPDCGGALWRHGDPDAIIFRCSVGHAYSPNSLDGEQGRAVESALWAAARLLGDRKTLLEEMAQRAASNGHDRSADAFRAQAEEATEAAWTVRGLIESGRLPLDAVSADVPHD